MSGPEERSVQLHARDIADVNEALAWVVSHIDTTYKAATMLKISIERFSASRGDEDGWHYEWEAHISGLVKGGHGES